MSGLSGGMEMGATWEGKKGEEEEAIQQQQRQQQQQQQQQHFLFSVRLLCSFWISLFGFSLFPPAAAAAAAAAALVVATTALLLPFGNRETRSNKTSLCAFYFLASHQGRTHAAAQAIPQH